MSRPALFLDRDGTIIEDVGYLNRSEQIQLIPGAAEAIRKMNNHGWPVVVITNQSAVARGYISEAELALIHQCFTETLQKTAQAHLVKIAYSPYHPTDGQGAYRRDSACRKPNPGLLLAAAEEFDIDLTQSWMVGDRLSDVQAGHNAGCRSILVRTGVGHSVEMPPEYNSVPVVDDLSAAVDYILSQLT